jgi:hydrogenase small subunit
MPGFPDKFMPFMDQPPGAAFSSKLVSTYGRVVRALRGLTNHTMDEEPKWHHNGPELTSGYDPYYSPGKSSNGRGKEHTR